MVYRLKTRCWISLTKWIFSQSLATGILIYLPGHYIQILVPSGTEKVFFGLALGCAGKVCFGLLWAIRLELGLRVIFRIGLGIRQQLNR